MAVRRAYLTPPGEMLFLPRSAPDLHQRLISLLSDSGLPADHVLVNSLIGVPIPRKDPAAGPRGWHPTINPLMLWHPLFWLTDRTAYPNTFTDDGQTYTEDDDHWAARIALELDASGVHSVTDGSWVDVLSLYGLDITDPAIQHRISTWLAGSPDPILDQVTLAPLLENTEDPHWASEHLDTMLETAKPASWGIMADTILDALTTTLPTATNQDEARTVIGVVCDMAVQLIGDAPTDDATDRAEVYFAISDAAFNPQVPFDTVYGQLQYLVNSITEVKSAFHPIYVQYVDSVAAELAND